MSERPPFDPVRAAFWLIAAVLGFQCLVGLVGLGHCVYWSQRIVEGKYDCQNIGTTLNSLMQGALAAALAFAAGFNKKEK